MKNKNSSKGFTLVELLAVMIILVVITLIALNAVRKNVDKTLDNTIVANAGMFIKGVNSFTEVESISNSDYEEGIFLVTDLMSSGVKISGTKPDSGYIVIEQSIVTLSCLQYGEYYVNYINNEYSNPKNGSCPMFEAEVTEFAYTGDVQTFTVSKTGNYLLRVWGAQGGNAGEYLGGYGGFSRGEMYLNEGDKLYIVVGGAGAQTTETTAGGYNGGGASGKNNAGYRGTGGGATSVAYKSGVLNSLSSSQNEVIIVAGGGGGANVWNSQYGYGGAGGGFTGMNGTTQNHTIGTGGTQTAGGTGYQAGTFGQGASAPTSAPGGAGGGGGYFGGGSSRDNAGAGGGSGYIGFESLSNKSMYCYNCTESSAAATKTISTTCVSETPTENCAKKGNGYVKISLLI